MYEVLAQKWRLFQKKIVSLFYSRSIHAFDRFISIASLVFDAALYDLYKTGKISYEEALKNADSKNNLRLRIQLSEGIEPDTEILDEEEDTGILSLVSKEERGML